MATITLHGGDCGLYWGGTSSGVFLRIMGQYLSPTDGLENVASVCRHLRYSSNYTDDHDVDEDLRVIMIFGGLFGRGNKIGVFSHNANHTPTEVWDTVASLKNIGHSR